MGIKEAEIACATAVMMNAYLNGVKKMVVKGDGTWLIRIMQGQCEAVG